MKFESTATEADALSTRPSELSILVLFVGNLKMCVLVFVKIDVASMRCVCIPVPVQ